jgi:hypothetical protein
MRVMAPELPPWDNWGTTTSLIRKKKKRVLAPRRRRRRREPRMAPTPIESPSFTRFIYWIFGYMHIDKA